MKRVLKSTWCLGQGSNAAGLDFDRKFYGLGFRALGFGFGV